ncbi:ubiquitin carboxyl-terminal hydrolase 2-like isoform X1 [Macrobrachium rosenbergii]|uniref:ubiquitin carboxyl-terminal hydrolase 2-like isoform X1 n=1 Tax=Macrobrachium rosenbergii TaxID=79674 RepID=UPI0034D793E0
MPVPPSSPSVGTSRYPSYTSYSSSYRSPSSSSYSGRTTSLDRSPYLSTYGSSYSSNYSTSTYTSKYSRPPIPSYSVATDTYRSSRSLRQSPVRPTYSRLSSDSSLESSLSSRYSTSRYSRDKRDVSTSRDSGYGSRLSSRDRSVDIINGNGVDTSHFGPSPSSYACNYRWEYREKDTKAETGGSNDTTEQNGEAEKVRVTDRIRNFETRSSAAKEIGGGLLAGRESSSTGRERGYSPAKDSSSVVPRRRMIPLTLVDIPKRSSSTTRKSPSTRDEDDDRNNNPSSNERRPSVTELCRKYDANHNVTNGVAKQDDEDEDEDDDRSDGSACSGGPAAAADDDAALGTVETVTLTLKTRPRTSSTSRADRRESPLVSRVSSPATGSRLDSPTRSRVESPARSRFDTSFKESPARNRFESPLRNRLDSSVGRPESPCDRDGGRTSPYVNGTLDKPKVRAKTESSSLEGSPLGRSRYRQERAWERIAARLANEDEGSPPRRHQTTISSNSCSSSVGGTSLSENNGLVGLRNIGNTCFMNSVTQCLSNTRCLLEYLVQDGYSSDINTTISTMKGDLIRAFANLLTDMWNEGSDSSRALNTGPFKSQIQRFAPAFSGYQQHDAQEFLRKLLEGLHEDVNRVILKPKPITEDIDDELDDNQKAMESWKRYLRYDDSKIVDMFVGQLKSCLQCSVCGHCSVTFDPFWDLSLPIPSKSGQVRLSQCLDLFTKEEVLDGDERPTCSKCKERRKMTKSFSIQKFPKVLVLHLKRFSPLERWRGKLSCTVEFPLENLDLSKFASSSTTSPSYNLIGVANHSGTTYSGHYTAYCKHPYSGAWHEYNDSRVSNISQGRVCSPEAYVLFYEMTSASSKL